MEMINLKLLYSRLSFHVMWNYKNILIMNFEMLGGVYGMIPLVKSDRYYD